jgi:pSer/pThr/pTyr-binding forkhead associated (FHA) protein
MVKLTIIAGPEAGKVFTQTQETFSIGRGEDCDVILQDGTVSRRHCRIQCHSQNKLALSDLNTPNGTFLNDPKTRVQTCELQSGDEIILGKSCLRVEFVAEVQGEQEPASTRASGDSDSGPGSVCGAAEEGDSELPQNWQSRDSQEEKRRELSGFKRLLATIFPFLRK